MHNNKVGANFSTFSTYDVAQIALQRTSSLLKWPILGRLSYSLWARGRSELLMVEARLRRKKILAKAFAELEREFEIICNHIGGKNVRNVVDIGCGHALIDLLFFKRFGCDLHLVDIEASAHRHHFYHNKGAGYASLAAAKDFLISNGVPPSKITTTNPNTTKLNSQGCDLVISLISCGFHYPADTYADYLSEALKPEGIFIFDMRKNSQQEKFLSRFSRQVILEENSKSKRLAVSL